MAVAANPRAEQRKGHIEVKFAAFGGRLHVERETDTSQGYIFRRLSAERRTDWYASAGGSTWRGDRRLVRKVIFVEDTDPGEGAFAERSEM